MTRESLWDRLALVSSAELRAMQQQLEDEYRQRMGRLDELEAQKTALDRQGAAERGLRKQEALAQRLADLDHQAALEARLLRLVGKQQRLLDRLIWLQESADSLAALRAASPAAVELDWEALSTALKDGLAGAASRLVEAEAKLDALLRILGIPEQEWPRAPRPETIPGGLGATLPGPDKLVLVAEVLDGRTIRLATGHTVRYIGVDAPLRQGALGRPDAGAEEAWLANRRLVEGQHVRLEADALDRSVDGVLWRYVWRGRTCVNAELIRRGVAYHLPLSPNYRYSEWFARMEREAERRKRGVWG